MGMVIILMNEIEELTRYGINNEPSWDLRNIIDYFGNGYIQSWECGIDNITELNPLYKEIIEEAHELVMNVNHPNKYIKESAETLLNCIVDMTLMLLEGLEFKNEKVRIEFAKKLTHCVP